MHSLGFIETVGLVAAMEAADAMTKAAYVQLHNVQYVACGMITLTVTGDLASVQAAVEAGCAAVRRLPGGTLLAHNVIGRPEYDINVFAKKEKSCCIPQKKKSSCCSSSKVQVEGKIQTQASNATAEDTKK